MNRKNGALARGNFVCIVACAIILRPTAARAQDIAISGATVYTSPDDAPLREGTVIVRSGKIFAVGAAIAVPKEIPQVACDGCAVFAGFWNNHVHFTGPQWTAAAQQSGTKLTAALQEMLTHSGFTTVVDCASDPENTIALRRRVEDGEVLGPRIYTAGAGLYPPHAIPYYLSDLPTEVRGHLPQPETAQQAIEVVHHNQALGTDIVKLFTGSYLTPEKIVPMPLDVAKAAVQAGHRDHQLVFAHPSNLAGVRIAIESGVDVLAHVPDAVTGIDDTVLRDMLAHHIAMVPTLKLFSHDNNISRLRQIVAQYHTMGGRLMFGTDTGFLRDYSVEEEYRQLGLAGLSFREVLAMLTTAPAEEFRVAAHAGRIRVANDGDLTVIVADPSAGKMEDFARVLYTIRAGRVIFARDHR